VRLDWLGNLFWVFVFIVAIAPFIQRRNRELRRTGGLQRLGRARDSQAVALIARRETYRLLSFPLVSQDVIDSSETLLREIARTPGTMPLDVILHVPPGFSVAAEQIAHALIRHPARVTVFVPHYALEGGALIALAADEIVLDPNAVLGPIAPRVGPYPAVSVLAACQEKQGATLDDRTLILADQARKVLGQTRALITELLQARGMEAERAPEVAAILTGEGWTPHYPILFEEAQRLGLPVSDELPAGVHALMDLYDLQPALRPSTSYVALTPPHEV
jgi:ClpP class serine protease